MPRRNKQDAPSYNPNVAYGDQIGAMDVADDDDTTGSFRRSSTNPDAANQFKNQDWFLSTMARKVVDKTMQTKSRPGDWVIRESESQAGALVMTFKAMNGHVHSKRIKFTKGLYLFEGDKKAYVSIPLLIKSDLNLKRPAGDLFGRTLKRNQSTTSPPSPLDNAVNAQRRPSDRSPSSPSQSSSSPPRGHAPDGYNPAPYVKGNQAQNNISRRRSDSFSGFGDVDTAQPPPQSRKESDAGGYGFGFDEEDTNANDEDFGGFEEDTKTTRKPSLRAAPKSNRAPSIRSNQSAPKRKLVEGEFSVFCEATDLAKSLRMTGECTLSVHNVKRQFSIQSAFDSSAKQSWTVTALRRYGREDGKFYFEAGRRCASGEGMMFCVGPDFDAIFDLVDAHVKSARQAMRAAKAAQAKALQVANAARAAKAAAEDARRRAEMERLAKEAEALAKKQIAEEKRKAENSRREREEQARQAEEERKRISAERADKPKAKESIYGSVAEIMTAAHALELSKEASSKLKIKDESGDKYASMFTAPKEQPKHSKIWLALNPQPLAYQTRDDRQESEDKIVMGAVGTRDFNMRRDMVQDAAMTVPKSISESPEDDTGFGMEQEVEIEDEADHIVDQIEESDDDDDYDPNAEVPEEELDNDDVTSFMAVLAKNRAQREKEEAENKRKLAEEYRQKEQARQKELDKELAVIAAKKKIEDEEKEREKDAAVAAAMASAAQLSFDFTFG